MEVLSLQEIVQKKVSKRHLDDGLKVKSHGTQTLTQMPFFKSFLPWFSVNTDLAPALTSASPEPFYLLNQFNFSQNSNIIGHMIMHVFLVLCCQGTVQVQSQTMFRTHGRIRVF